MSIATSQDHPVRFVPFTNLSKGVSLKEIAPFRRPAVSHRRVKKHARKILRFLSRGSSYKGEVFLCGGAFKHLINTSLKLNDIDLWVRNRREREALMAELLIRGARLVRDFHPYCILFDFRGPAIEITYQNVKNRQISEIVDGFDLAGCAIAATYSHGRIVDSYINPLALSASTERTACLEKSYLNRLRTDHMPSVLRSIDRLQRFAKEVGYRASQEDIKAMWAIFFNEYSAEERQECIDVYLKTTAGYKGQHDEQLLEMARL